MIFICYSLLSRNVNDITIKKFAQAASENKPVLQQIHINELNRKLEAWEKIGKNTADNLKKKSNKPWWIYPSSPSINLQKKFGQHLQLEIPQKIQQEKSLNEKIVSPKFSPINNQYKNINLSPDMEIDKITTIIEAIRRKQQGYTQTSEETENIQRIIKNKRSKRSSHVSENKPKSSKDSRYPQKEKASTSNKRSSRYPKRHSQNQQKQTAPTRRRAADLEVAGNAAISSNVFYKRIWEYINGTRPHFDIINGDNSLENNSEKENTTCTDKDRITVSQSLQKKDLQMINNIKPEREFYKRIWDIINATQSAYGNAKPRSKRSANIPKNNGYTAASSQLCMQERKANNEGDKQLQTTNEKTALDTTDTINSRETSDPGPYISGFWSVANKTQWQPKRIPITNVESNESPISSSQIKIMSASEVADLNKFPDEVQNNVDYSSSENSTEYIEVRNKSQEIIEPGPPYSSQQENSTTSSLSPIERTIDIIPQKEDQVKYTENYSADETVNKFPTYDPANIPYVEVPDYSDQREESLDKSNQSSTTAKYNENDYSDYVDPEQSYNTDDFSSKYPNIVSKLLENVQTENNEPEISLNANISHSHCAENKDSAECIDKYNVEDTKVHNNTEDNTSNVQYSAEDSAEPVSEERENSTVDFDVNFDINEYKKPFNLNNFIENDPIFKSIRAASSKENTKYEDKENPNHREESEEFYIAYPEEQSYDYSTKNEDYNNDYGTVFDEKENAKKNTDAYAKEEAKDSEIINENPYSDKDFLKHIFEKDSDEKSSDIIDTEDEFLSHYFTEDVLRQLQDNSTNEEDRQKEESRNKENIQETLSKILDKKDRFSRLDEDLDKMIEEGKTIPIKYNNFWSLEYESPHKRNKAKEEAEA